MGNIKENDLVMIRLNNDPLFEGRQRHYNTWFSVMFVDNDGTFIGRVERIDKFEFLLYKIGEDIKLNLSDIQQKYNEGEQWCYGDNITICDCRALCRNKM